MTGRYSSALVVAPHPDDEVLGVGGSIARLAANGTQVLVAVVTKGDSQLFDPGLIERGREEASRAHAILGVAETLYLDFPAAKLDQVPHHEVNASLTEIVRRWKPDIMFVPFGGDLHLDHRLVFDSCLVAARPTDIQPGPDVLAYETLSETNWSGGGLFSPSFVPDTYVRLREEDLARKLVAMEQYVSQLREFPHERSLRAVDALARSRGATINATAAEAFVTVRRTV